MANLPHFDTKIRILPRFKYKFRLVADAGCSQEDLGKELEWARGELGNKINDYFEMCMSSEE